MSEFTLEHKLEAIEREILMRRKTYPGLVIKGKMRRAVADREIAIMEAIAKDYDKQLNPELPL